MTTGKFHILSRAEAISVIDPLLGDRTNVIRPTGIISISAASDERVPSQIPASGIPFLALFFDDVSRDLVDHGYFAPTEKDVRSAIDWSREHDGMILVHCHAGVSRSAGIALAVIASRHDPTEVGAMKSVLELIASVNGTCAAGLRDDVMIVPNSRIVLLADRILGYEGALLTLYVRTFARRDIWTELGEKPPDNWRNDP